MGAVEIVGGLRAWSDYELKFGNRLRAVKLNRLADKYAIGFSRWDKLDSEIIRLKFNKKYNNKKSKK